MNKNTALHRLRNTACTCALLTMALLSLLYMLPGSALSAETTSLTILHSGHVQGHLFPCPT